MNTSSKNFHLETRSDGVVLATLDVPERGMNVFDQSVIEELESLVSTWESANDVTAIVFRSGKPSGFLAGADIQVIRSLSTPDEADAIIARGQNLFSRIEALLMPTIAVIHGPCLGGGLEFALACDFRIARDDASTRLGLPETQLGVIPGWGGTQRLPRQVGLMNALEMILTGKKVAASKAKKMGLVDRSAPPESFDATLEEFVQTVIASPSAASVSRSPRRPLLAWLVNHTAPGRWLAFRQARQKLAKQAKNYPALMAAVDAIEASYRTPGQPGMDAERKAFCDVLFTPTCRNLIGLFFQREKARTPSTWAEWESIDSMPKIQTLGVIGSGAMGAGIAQLAAYQGLNVILREINEDALTAGMSRIQKLFDDLVAKRRLTAEEAAHKMSLVTPTVDWEPLCDADAVVEAVVERTDIKEAVFGELEQHTSSETVLATNTSSLSVSELTERRQHPDRVAGLHFFNPVHRMELVEVVRTSSTSPQAIAQLVQLVKTLGKTPVVVEDSPGFVVNRILFPYLAEAVRMVCEGGDVVEIDRALKKFGMPMGPLELLDQVGLDIGAHVASGLADVIPDPGPTADRLSQMVNAGWLGKKSGQGFYHYDKGRKGKPTVWSSDESMKPAVSLPRDSATGLSLIELRLVMPIINEAVLCLREKIVTGPWMIDLAMVLGTGFAPFRGGPLKLADTLGLSNVVGDLQMLEELFGDRFAPCELLVHYEEQRQKFYAGPKPKHSTSQETVEVEQ